MFFNLFLVQYYSMLKVRLQRTGKRGQAYFRVVVVEHTKKPKGKFLELLGNYDPHKKEFKVNMERVNYWISKGTQVSPTVNNLLVNYKYWDKPKMLSWKPKKKQATSDQQQTTKKETSSETTVEQKLTEETKEEAKQEEVKQEESPIEPAPEV